jgi:hypothetical protein
VNVRDLVTDGGWDVDPDDEVLFVRHALGGDRELRFECDMSEVGELSGWTLVIHQDVRDEKNRRTRYVCSLAGDVGEHTALEHLAKPPAAAVDRWRTHIDALTGLPDQKDQNRL